MRNLRHHFKETDKQLLDRTSGRKLYHAPKLVVHGKLTDLTTAGSGASAEQNSGQGAVTKRT